MGSLLSSQKTWVGLGAGLVLPKLFPVVGHLTREVAKGAVKAYLAVRDSVKSSIHEAGEQWNDLVEEVRSERKAEDVGFAAAMAGAQAGTTEGKEHAGGERLHSEAAEHHEKHGGLEADL